MKLAIRLVKYLGRIAFRAFNRLRYIRHEERYPDYAIINDGLPSLSTMLYFISIESTAQALEAAGFDRNIVVYDRAGRGDGDSRDGTIALHDEAHLIAANSCLPGQACSV